MGIPTMAMEHSRIDLDPNVAAGKLDMDFGELARNNAAQATYGIILFRTPVPRPADAGRRLTELISGRDDWLGHFSVVEIGRIRMRRLVGWIKT